MGKSIVKPVREEDFYVEWSSIVDNWTLAGTREAMIEDGVEPERLDRADSTGSSSFVGWYGWEDTTFLVHNLPDEVYEPIGLGAYTIKREDFHRLVELTQDGVELDLEELEKILVFEEWE